MPEYRKKPVKIWAESWDGTPERALEIATWANSDESAYNSPVGQNVLYQQADQTVSLGTDDVPEGTILDHPEIFVVITREGTMTISPGDYVIQGVQGEFYPCKPDIFAQTYDEVPDAE